MTPTLILIFVFAALTAYAAFRVVSPFLESEEAMLQRELLDEELREIERLVARKSVLLQSLKDIEFDHDTGKLSDSDYERLKSKYERRAVEVMKTLDELRGGVDREDEIDTELQRRLSTGSDAASDRVSEADDEEWYADDVPEEETDARSPDEAALEETVRCPECDKELEAEARFCSRCGVALDKTESAPGSSDTAGDFESNTAPDPSGSDTFASPPTDDLDETSPRNGEEPTA